MNWCGIISSTLNRRKGIHKNYSVGPFISAVFAVMAYIVYPFRLKGWVFIIPVIDIGNWTGLIGLPLATMRGAFKGAFTFKKEPPRDALE
jgi:hypothetical protein